MEIKGVLKKKFPVEQRIGKYNKMPYQAQALLIEANNSGFPNQVLITVFEEWRIKFLERLAEGDNIIAEVRINSVPSKEKPDVWSSFITGHRIYKAAKAL